MGLITRGRRLLGWLLLRLLGWLLLLLLKKVSLDGRPLPLEGGLLCTELEGMQADIATKAMAATAATKEHQEAEEKGEPARVAKPGEQTTAMDGRPFLVAVKGHETRPAETHRRRSGVRGLPSPHTAPTPQAVLS